MLRWTLSIFLAATVLLSAGSAQSDAQAAKKKKGQAAELTTRAIFDKLETSVDTKGTHEKIKLKQALEWLNYQLGGRAPILLDKQAFLDELGAEAPDPFEEEVSLPPVPARMKAAHALRLILSQISKGSATYLVRNGIIEITTGRRASPEALLAYPISVRLDKKPFDEVMEMLSESSGATIVIDTRIGDKARTPVSANFRGTITLEGAVRLLAEMADLQADMQENVLFITSKPKAGGQAQKADLHLKNRRLDLAVKDLAAWSGQTVLLDPAYIPPALPIDAPFGGGRAKRLEAAAVAEQIGPGHFFGPDPLADPRSLRVTATFKANVSVKAAAEIIARQANLSVLVLDNALYITHPLAAWPLAPEKEMNLP